MKDKQIEELKKNIKMSRHREAENEIQAYADECVRLRNLFEQTLMERDGIIPQLASSSPPQHEQSNLKGAIDTKNEQQEGQARLQEALFEQENILNQEREEKNNLHVTLMGTKEEHNKLMDRLKVAETKAKKQTQVETEVKRK